MKLAVMKQSLLKYARYNQWANQKLVTLVSTQTPELLEKEIASSFNSIKKTILHMADAGYIWHCRVTGAPPDKIPGKSGAGIEALDQTDQKLIEFIESKDDLYFTRSTSYKSIKGEPFNNNNAAIFWHVFNHGTFHRGQIVSMLRNGGYRGPVDSTDFIAFERK
ncbi:MAG TPA: DinB family protein [Bacteroidia bacterium]|jgi:uncharacterized damage-inducible protein DinB|nr:DinB family protein [Bacteroidia bacterium]